MTTKCACVELWSNHGHALATLGGGMLRRLNTSQRSRSVDLPCDHSTNDVKRIAFSDEIVAAFGY